MTTEFYSLSLHDALPISEKSIVLRFQRGCDAHLVSVCVRGEREQARMLRRPAEPPDTRLLRSLQNRDFTDEASNSPADRKSTRLNSSHLGISYAVFCLKK